MELQEKIFEIEHWIEDCYKKNNLHYKDVLLDVSIEAGNHIRYLTLLTAGLGTEEDLIRNDNTYKLEDAVIIGHLIRIFKLYEQLVYFISTNQGEISSIFLRPIFEAFVHMKYLIIKGEDSIKSFIKCSYKSAIQNYKHIKKQENDRELISIEKRIIDKIENRIERVNLTIEELSENKNWKLDGKSFKNLIDFLHKNDNNNFDWSNTYSFVFGSSSAFVHGSWYDIELNQLVYNKEKGRYSPKYDYRDVDPRYILSPSLIPLYACKDFLKWRRSDPDNVIINILDKMIVVLKYLTELDEAGISEINK